MLCERIIPQEITNPCFSLNPRKFLPINTSETSVQIFFSGLSNLALNFTNLSPIFLQHTILIDTLNAPLKNYFLS